MELHDLLLDREFLSRKNVPNRAERRFEALQALTRVFTETPQAVLQKLEDIAVEFCGADSAGISLENPEAQKIRWVALQFPEASRSTCMAPRRDSLVRAELAFPPDGLNISGSQSRITIFSAW